MNPGELNKKVTIQRPVHGTADESTGAVPTTWEDVAGVWARIEPLSGREYFQAAQVQSEVTHRVTIWYRRDFSSSYRLRYVDRLVTRYLEILSVIDPAESHEGLILMCVERE